MPLALAPSQQLQLRPAHEGLAPGAVVRRLEGTERLTAIVLALAGMAPAPDGTPREHAA